MKEVALTKGYVTLVDDEDYDLLMHWKWRYSDGYAKRGSRVGGKQPGVYMHRVILNAPDDVWVDHKDRNKLNNQRGNLRIATHIQNQRNKSKHGRNGNRAASQYKGVCFDKRRGLWYSIIRPNKIAIWLGYFDIEREAAQAYDTAAVLHFGEFASLNFPKEC